MAVVLVSNIAGEGSASGDITAVTAGAGLTGGGASGAISIALSSPVAIADGGTGQDTAPEAINALLPDQTGNSGEFLTTNGSVASWAAVAAGANTALSNLAAPTAMNEDLIFNKTNGTVQTQNKTGATASEPILILSGSTVDGNSGAVVLNSGGPSGNGSSGDVELGSAPTVGGNSGGVDIVSGGSADGGDTGYISLRTGTTSGTQGKIFLVDGTEGTAGHVWTSTDANGAGEWAAASGGGANTALSNLVAPTAVSEDLLFDTGTDGQLKTKNDTAATKRLVLESGESSSNASGPVSMGSGAAAEDFNSGDVDLYSGPTTGTGVSGSINLTTGNTADAVTGSVLLLTGQSDTDNSGSITLSTGLTSGAVSGLISISTGDDATGETGELTIRTGNTLGGAITGAIAIETGSNNTNTDTLNTGDILISSGAISGDSDGSFTGAVTLSSGATTTGDITSGNVLVKSGDSNYQSGNVEITSGNGTVADDGFSGFLVLSTGDVTGTAPSGEIYISPGTVGTGARGWVEIGSRVQFDSTVTAGGTTGNQTIDKTSGTVNFANATAALTVTNSIVTANSIVFAVVRTNDTTAQIKNVVPGSGTFTINLVANATAETSVGFFVSTSKGLRVW